MTAARDRSASPREVDDLEWRFNGEAEAEMGLSSNLAGFIALIERGVGSPSGGNPDYDGRAVAAASRAREIDLALSEAGKVRGHSVQRLAQLHFGTPPPPWSLGGCGPTGATPHLTPLLELLPEAREEHARARSRLELGAWLLKLGAKLARGAAERRDAVAGARLREIGELLVLEVVLAYSTARKRLPRHPAPRAQNRTLLAR
jgi:hypothetical protein